MQLEEQKKEKQASLAQASQKLAAIKGDYDNSTNTLKQTENLLQTLITGLSSSSNEADSVSTGYMGQIATARNKASTSATEAGQAKARIEHLQRELKEKEPRAKKALAEDGGLTKELQKAKDLVQKLTAELGKLDWDDSREAALRDKKDNAGKAVRELLEKRDHVKSRLANLDFNYQLPSRDFDRSKVKGLVASLISIDPANYKYSTALEVCAGGRLYNVCIPANFELYHADAPSIPGGR
jgi:structural maintenance of chromosome 2